LQLLLQRLELLLRMRFPLELELEALSCQCSSGGSCLGNSCCTRTQGGMQRQGLSTSTTLPRPCCYRRQIWHMHLKASTQPKLLLLLLVLLPPLLLWLLLLLLLTMLRLLVCKVQPTLPLIHPRGISKIGSCCSSLTRSSKDRRRQAQPRPADCISCCCWCCSC
jgi:hypothetical protein